MPAIKRKRYSKSFINSQPAYAKRYKRARAAGTTGMAGILRASVRRANKGVKRLTRMIETKEACFKTTRPGVIPVPQGFDHNEPRVIDFDGTLSNNIFTREQGLSDPMGNSKINMIGDSYKLQGLSCHFFFENPYRRSKTYYRIMFLRGPRGAAFTDCFKGNCGNKMIDQFNTEKYRIIASKTVTVTPSNTVAQTATGTGEAVLLNVNPNTTTYGGVATRVIKMWIPGTKITKSGIISYENQSNDVKFYDYRWVMVCYDWNGTPSDINTVGTINEGYVKIYYKDA